MADLVAVEQRCVRLLACPCFGFGFLPFSV